MTSEALFQEGRPDRWLHVRHRRGFADEQWKSFQAHCRYFQATADALLANWIQLGRGDRPLRYIYFPPELSKDRTVATLPLGGDRTLGSRAAIENGLSSHLWCFLLEHMPIEDFVRLEEGLTEHDLMDLSKLTTNWRPIARAHLGQMDLDAESERATELVKGKVVTRVVRNSTEEICIEFADGNSLYVDRSDGGIELSVTGARQK